jgi:translation elongation factor EF-4
VFHSAKERGLKIIPILNKVSPWGPPLRVFAEVDIQIDLPAAEPERIAAQIESIFGIDPVEIVKISAKTGLGVNEVLRAIIERIPPPAGSEKKPLKAFLFDSS